MTSKNNNSHNFLSYIEPALTILLALGLALALTLVLTTILGEPPLMIAKLLATAFWNSPYEIGQTIFSTAILSFTGLSVALAYQAGWFNIGAEGQLNLGCLAAVAVGIFFPLPAPWSWIAAFCAAALAGGLWASIAGIMKLWRQTNEVVSTILLNFVAYSITSWLVLTYIPTTESQNPESLAVTAGYLAKPYEWFQGSPVTWICFVPIILCLLFQLITTKTKFGFNMRMTGANATAAKWSGISAEKIGFQAFVISGAVAGLVGFMEVCGNSERMRLSFSSDYGFSGIAVALIAGARPVNVIAAAFLVGALQTTTQSIELETTYLTKEIILVIQALMVICIVLRQRLFDFIKRQFGLLPAGGV